MLNRDNLLVVLALALVCPWQTLAQTLVTSIALDFEGSAAGTSTSSPTYVSDLEVERQILFCFTGLPTTDGHLFTVMSYTPANTGILRGFSRTGTLNLLYNSDWTGVAWHILKFQQTGITLVESVLYASDLSIGVRAVPLTINGNLFAAVPASAVSDTSLRVILTRDKPGTVYFFGISTLALHKYDVTTAVSVLDSGNLGDAANYPISLIYSESTDSVFAWWIGSSTLALFSSTNFETPLRTRTQEGYFFSIERAVHQILQNNLNETEIFELKNPENPIASCQLGKRLLSSPTLNLGAPAQPIMTFWTAMLINLGPLNYLGIAPSGINSYTAAALKGTITLTSKPDFSSTFVFTLPSTIEFSLMRFAPNTAVTVTLTQPPEMMYYIGFYHNTNFNFQTYYFVLSSCEASGFVSCKSCPSGYWLADPATYMTPGPCKLAADIPESNGMDNSTLTYKPCRLTTCSDCRYDYSTCTTGATPVPVGVNYDNLTKDGSLGQAGSFVPEGSNLQITFSFEPEYLPDFDTVVSQLKLTDLVTGTVYTFKQLNGKATRNTRGFSVSVSVDQNILSAVATIEKSSTFSIVNRRSASAFDRYPIELGGIYIIADSAAMQPATATIEGASNSRAVISLLLIAANPMASVFLDYLFSELFILKQYEGEFLAYPEIVLRTTAQSALLPFEVPNIYEAEEDPECTPESTSLQQNEISCMTMNNFGEDAVTLTGYFLFGGVVSSLAMIITKIWGPKKEGEEMSKFIQAVDWLNFSFGMKIFHAKMEGEKMEVVFHIVLGLFYRKQSFNQPINIVFVIILYIYYWTIGMMSVFFAAEVGRYLSKSPAVLQMLKQHNLDYLKELVEFEEQVKQDQVSPDTLNLLMSVRVMVRSMEKKIETDLPRSILRNLRHTQLLTLPKAEKKNTGVSEADPMLEPRRELPGFHIETSANFHRRNPQVYKDFVTGTLESQPSHRSSHYDNPASAMELPEIPEEKAEVEAESAPIQRGKIKTEELERTFTVNVKKLIDEKLQILNKAVPPATKKSVPKLAPFVPEAKEVIDLRSHKWKQITFFIEDMTIPKNDFYKYTALAALFRSTLLAIILVRVTEQPRTQVVLGIVIESLYLVYMRVSVCKAELTEYYVELAMHILRIVYLALKLLASVDTLSMAFKQNYLGVLMAILLVLVCLINILFMIYSVGELVVELAKACWYKLKGNSEESKD